MLYFNMSEKSEYSIHYLIMNLTLTEYKILINSFNFYD